MFSFRDYYLKRINEAGGLENYISIKAKEKKPLFDKIKKNNPKKIIEAGCGSSINLIILAKEGYECIGIDKDPDMIKLSKELADRAGVKLTLKCADILKSEKIKSDVVFSHGVLEHFKDEDIVKMLNAELKMAPKVVLSVPGDYFTQDKAIEGNERFLSKRYWKELLKKTEGRLSESFDYMFLNPSLSARIKHFIYKATKGYMPRKKPYLGFVVVK